MTREEIVKNLLTELIDMIDNGSQRDLDRADEIGTFIIKLFKQESVLDKIRKEIKLLSNANPSYWDSDYMVDRDDVLKIIDKYKTESEV